MSVYWAFALLFATASAAAAPPAYAPLLAELAKKPGVYAHFSEKKTMAMLVAPLESSGELYYAAPNLLARYTQKPENNVVVLESHRVRFYDGKTWQTVDYANKPVVKELAESLLGILRGDVNGLEKLYRLEWSQKGQTWTLVLRPKLAPMNQLVERLELQGQGLVIAQLRVVEAGGDETLTTYTQVDTARVYTAADRKRIFALEPK